MLVARDGTSTLVISPSPSTTAANDGGFSSNNSFVGNTPSTVLFFLALAVGVFIAFLFIFFTVRYFVRSKYGLHVYPISHRNVLLSRGSLPNVMEMNTTNEELQGQLDYIRDHHFIRDEFLERRMGERGRRRRRRGGRYARMKKLTEEQVDILFPKKTYHDWLNGGKERDHEKRDGVLQEEGGLLKSNCTDSSNEDIIELNENQVNNLDRMMTNNTLCSNIISDANQAQSSVAKESIELKYLNSEKDVNEDDELHFTSGSCAICLEVLEDDDNVRGLICGHVFHSNCLDPWLTKRRACCPMCKRDYFFKDENNNSRSANDNDSPNNEGTSHNNNNNNEENQNDDTVQDDSISIDYDTLRNDPALRAMIQELVPTSERVRLVLENTNLADLNLEERANEIANKKYSNFKIFWWKLMGVKKDDLFNWAVLLLCQRHRQAHQVEQTNDSSNNENNHSSNVNNEDSGNGDGNENNEDNGDGNNEHNDNNDNNTSTNSSTNNSNSQSDNLSLDHPSEESRREVVEQRV